MPNPTATTSPNADGAEVEDRQEIQGADGTEASKALGQLAGRRTLPIPADLLVGHALSLPGDWDWPVRRAAFEAILRRLASARAQEIAIAARPRRGPWGRYTLGRPEVDGALPYDVRLASLQPLRGSCDCPDYLRGSLGLCKHLLAVIDALARNARVFARSASSKEVPARPLGLVWDPTSAAAGPGDPLDALRLVPPRRTTDRVPVAMTRAFRRTKAGPWPLAATRAPSPEARMRLVRDLQTHAGGAGASADPAARAVLAEEHARLDRILRLRAAAPRLQRALGRSKRRLYSYQKAGVARFLAEGRLVLADDMGLGKTTQAIVAASALFEVGLVRRGLLVVPAALKGQWEREWQAVSTLPLRVLDGGFAERRAVYSSTQRGFLVTNYEQVVRDLPAIAEWSPDLVILDEAQRIKNWATKTALTVKRLRPEFRLVLTGTPMENRLEELASIVEWVDDRALEPKWRLGPWHSTFADGSREVVGARNLDSLRVRLAPVLLRRIRSEVLSQLPRRQDSVIPVDMTDEQRAAHDELHQPIAKIAAIARRRPLMPAEFLRLMSLLTTQRVIANGMAQLTFEATWPGIRNRTPAPALIASLGAPKLGELRELVSSLVVTQGRKVVVFSQWRRMLELAAWAVSDLLRAEGLRALFFTGKEGARRRTQNLVEFHDDPKAAMLFLSDAGGVGLNLQKAANACVNLELPWNPAVLEQRIGRIHRIGQKRPIDVYNLVSRACIEERIAGLVADKRALFKGLFEGGSDELRFERSSALIHMLERLAPTAAAPVESAASTASTARSDEEAGMDGLSGVDGEGTGASASEIDGLVAAADPADQSAFPLGVAPADLPTSASSSSVGASASAGAGAATDVAAFFQALTVERSADGGIRIEAPPHAASGLLSLFEGMARLLGAVAQPAVPPAAVAPASRASHASA